MLKPLNADGTICFDTPEGIAFYRMAALKGALKLECFGMKHSRGSAYATCKREYGLKGNKQKVLEQMQKLVDDAITAKQKGKG